MGKIAYRVTQKQCFLAKTGQLKFEHPVTRLFFLLQGGSTTQINRLELLFSGVLSRKFYLKIWVQGDQK